MFLTINDLHAKMRESDLRQIVAGNDTIVPHAIAVAEGKVHSILAKKFDIEKLFEKTAELRESIIVSACCDIAIYEIVSLALPNIDLEDRRVRALQAIEYLTKIADGEYVMPWALLPDDKKEDSPVEFGGRPQRGNYY